MRLNGVNLPDALVDAAERQNLVVFAGAGISIGPPSNLPGFSKLTSDIAAGTGLLRDPSDEPFDRFLGRVQRQGTRVHERAREILMDSESLPTDTHRVLLRLFHSPESVRIVTTNFDSHFEAAWADVYAESDMRRHCAPALPLGRDFEGIVHIHGSVEDDQRMVLTDIDFGRAYVTEAWATRFLAELFLHFTVLFVGYSHEDTLADYLARALPGGEGERRFALVDTQHDVGRWRARGIEPVLYENPDDTHAVVPALISAWADANAMSLSDHATRVKTLVATAPDEVGDDIDYIRDAFREGASDSRAAKARSFYSNAKSIDWLDWADREGILAPLFADSASQDETHHDLAWWVARNFAVAHTDELLLVVADKGGGIGPLLWTAIAQTLHATDDLPPGVLRAWAPLLTSREPTEARDFIAYLLDKCSLPEDSDVLLHLLTHLMTPAPHLESSLLLGRTPRVSAALKGSDHWIRETLTTKLRPHLAEFAMPLVTMLTGALEAATRIEMIGPGDSFDSITFGRSAIEPHEQDSLSTDFGPAIDTLRDIADWAIQIEDDQLARGLFELWHRSDASIVRRLALHLLRHLSFIDADDRVRYVLGMQGLDDRTVKHEVYVLFRDLFTNVSPEVQREVVDAALRVSEELDPEYQDYFLFNLMDWLAATDPDSEPVGEVLAEIRVRNPDFERREYPDLNSWSGPAEWAPEESPLSETQVHRAQLGDLLVHVSDSQDAHDRVLDAIAVVARGDVHWSISRIKEASASTDAARSVKVTAAILAGWERAELSPEEREAALASLEGFEELQPLTRELSGLLRAWGSGSDPSSLTPEAWKAARVLAERLERCMEGEQWVTDPDEHGWHLVAFNHSAWRLTLFWLNYLAMLRKADSDPGWRIPEDIGTSLLAMAKSSERTGVAARTALMAEFSFLYEIDPEWSLENLMPLLDPSSEYSEEAWDGLLAQPRRSVRAWRALLPAYRKLLGVLGSRQPRVREPLINHCAFLCAAIEESPVESGLIYECLRTFTSEERGSFTMSLGRALSARDTEELRELWSRWLSSYIHDRAQGVPVAVSSAELTQLFDWPVRIPELFCELVQSILELPRMSITESHSVIPHQLLDTSLPEDHPTEVLQLLNGLLAARAAGPFWEGSDVVKVMDRCLASGGSKEVAAAITNELVRLGYLRGN